MKINRNFKINVLLNAKVVVSLSLILLLSACGGKKSENKIVVEPVERVNTTLTTNKKIILFFGDSLTAGFGLDDPSQAFPGVIQRKVDSLKLPYTVVNAGISGETSAGGLARIDWILKKKVDIFVLELGANDGLRGIPVKETTQNLQAIINAVKAKYPKVKLLMLGMQVPPSMGKEYVALFNVSFPKLATKNRMILMPFLLNGVAGNAKLNQSDGIHPTAGGAKIVGQNVWKYLRREL
jgi:acyl-CoA thioesterase I